MTGEKPYLECDVLGCHRRAVVDTEVQLLCAGHYAEFCEQRHEFEKRKEQFEIINKAVAEIVKEEE